MILDFFKKVAVSVLSLMILLSLLVPIAVVAQESGSGVGETGSGIVCPPGKICNPLKADSIYGFLEQALGVVLRIGMIIVVMAIIYSGFLFVKAQGSEEGLTKAKDTFTYTIVGAAILLGSWVMAKMIQATINAISNTAL